MAQDWHLDKRLSIGNIIAIGAIALTVIVGWNKMTTVVAAQGSKLERLDGRQDRQRDTIIGNKETIQKLNTDTAVIKANQEQMQRVQEENREDIKEILRAVKK
jgi:hypothetical protein